MMAPTAEEGKGGCPLPVDPAGIPAELKKLPRWLAWELHERGGAKPAKRPLNVRTGRPADVTNRRHYAGFDDAIGFHLTHHTAGVGLGLFSADPFTAADFDGCLDPTTGDLDPLVADALVQLDTYAEVSPSGRGVRAFGLGKLDAAGRNRAGAVELYDHARYVTVTGRKLPTARPTVEPREAELRRLQATLSPVAMPRRGPATGGGFGGADVALLDRAFGAKNGAMVRALWEGRHGKPSASEALLGLARLLAFWTGPDPARLEGLIVAAPLFAATEAERVKWHDRRRGGSWGSVYVVRRAIDSCPVFFSGAGLARPSVPDGTENPPTCVSTSVQKNPLRPIPRNPVSEALRRVEAGSVPAGLDAITSPHAARQNALRRFAAVVWHLAGRRVGGRCTVGVEAAGRAFGRDHSTVSRWLNDLRRRKVVRRVRWGNNLNGRCSTWEWRGFPA